MWEEVLRGFVWACFALWMAFLCFTVLSIAMG